MEIADGEVCLKAFNDLCEELSSSELVESEELQYWVFERGYKAALEAVASELAVDIQYLTEVWNTQPSIEQIFAVD